MPCSHPATSVTLDAVGISAERAGDDEVLLLSLLLLSGVGSEPGARSIPSLAFGGWLERSMVTMLVFSDELCRKDMLSDGLLPTAFSGLTTAEKIIISAAPPSLLT